MAAFCGPVVALLRVGSTSTDLSTITISSSLSDYISSEAVVISDTFLACALVRLCASLGGSFLGLGCGLCSPDSLFPIGKSKFHGKWICISIMLFFQIPYLYVCKIEFAIMLNKYSLN